MNIQESLNKLVERLQNDKKTIMISAKKRAIIRDNQSFERLTGGNCYTAPPLYRFIRDKLPEEVKYSISDHAGDITYQVPSDKNFPGPASLVRKWLTKCKRTHIDYILDHPSPKDFNRVFAVDMVDMFTSRVKDKKYSPLEKYMADFISVEKSVSMKAHISSVWPKYRGMFGDHVSCYYPTREYGHCSSALEKFGYIVRLYEDSVSDEAIYANPDNPLNVENPLDNMPDEDGNCPYDDDNIDNTDGCLGRCLVMPNAEPLNTCSVFNAYSHRKKGVNVTRDDVADALAHAISSPADIAIALSNVGVTDSRKMFVNKDRAAMIIDEKDNISPFYGEPHRAPDYAISFPRSIRLYIKELQEANQREGEGEGDDW